MAKNVTSADIFGGMFQNLRIMRQKEKKYQKTKKKKILMRERKKIRRGNDQTGTTDNIS